MIVGMRDRNWNTFVLDFKDQEVLFLFFNSCDSIYHNICFIVVVWSQTHNISEVCLHFVHKAFSFFLINLHSMWDLSSSNQGLNPCPLQWKHRVLILTTRSPGKSLRKIFFFSHVWFIALLFLSLVSKCHNSILTLSPTFILSFSLLGNLISK